jgi:single-stranded-DNA-specific exonuclease
MGGKKHTEYVPPPAYHDDRITNLQETYTLSRPTVCVLLHRGLDRTECIDRFLSPSLEDLHDPFAFNDMERAIQRIMKAIADRERVLVYGDYDVDGVTSIALLVRNLVSLNADVVYFVPHRLKEGYGFSDIHLKAFKKNRVSLIITVDCGINAQQAISKARALGIDVIVTDHHPPQRALEGACAVIDPKGLGERYPFKDLAGVGVAFKLVDALLKKQGCEMQHLADLDLVALGTVADIVPLVDENRILAKVGMEALGKTEKVGLRALMEKVGRTQGSIGTYDIGFILGPRLNAGGRLESAEPAIELLLTEDRASAWEYATALDEANRRRQELHEKVVKESIAMIEAGGFDKDIGAIVLAKEDWHEGVVGIAASKLVERYARPTILISTAGTVGKGSGRSIHAFGLLDALHSCKDYLIRYGGHTYAAGITIEKERIPLFRKAMNAVVKETLSEEDLITKVYCDYELGFSEINRALVRELELLEPFGVGNPRPVFLTLGVQVVGYPRRVGTNHLKLKLRQGENVFDAIGFGMADDFETMEQTSGSLTICYRLEENEYRKRKSIQLRLVHLESEQPGDGW